MDAFEIARELYRDGTLLIDATRELASAHDLLRLVREELEEDLFELKQAVLDGDGVEVGEVLRDARQSMRMIHRILRNDIE